MTAFFYWWLKNTPEQIFFLSKKTVVYLYAYFSIPLLLKTLLDPWKKDEIDTTNMALDDIIRVKMMNIVSRLVGGVVRSIVINVGFLSIFTTIIFAIISYLGFMLLPVIVIYLIINGLARL